MASFEALIRQLLSGSPLEQHQAVAGLLLLPRSPQYWVSAVGSIPHLVRLLHSTSTAAPQARAIRCLLQHIVGCTGAYITNRDLKAAPDGLIPSLVSLLGRHDDRGVQFIAATTLSTLAMNFEDQDKIIEAGAITPLVQLLQPGPDIGNLQSAAAFALANISYDGSGQACIIAAGAIAPLVQLLQQTSSEELPLYAAMVFANLASHDAKAVVRAGAIPLLLTCMTDCSAVIKGQAAEALAAIADDSDTHAAILAASPLLPLVQLLSSRSEEAQENAQKTLLHLSNTPTFPQQFVAAGAIPPLVDLLRSESASMQQRAVAVLTILAAKGQSDIFAHVERAGALPLLAHLQASASSEAIRYSTWKLLRALNKGTTRPDDPDKGSSSALLPTAASVRPAPASGSPSTAATAEPPAAASPQPRKSCWSCGATGVPMKKCSVCAVAVYCGAGCQKADWKAHKKQCAGLKAGAAAVLEGAAGP